MELDQDRVQKRAMGTAVLGWLVVQLVS